MRFNYELTLEQTQKLIITPELRQAIQLLQYTSLELHEYIAQELEENPLLDFDESEIIEPVELNPSTDIDWKEYIEKYDDISYKNEIDKNIPDYSFEAFTSKEQTLHDELFEQLNMVTVGAREKKIGEYIIHSIDDTGYLVESTEDIAKQIGVGIEEVEMMLYVIQSFEPIGVGARDLKECLLIQVRDSKDRNLIYIIENHLEDMALNKLSKIATNLGLDIEKTQQYVDRIKSLEPKPGRSFKGSSEQTKYIIPDATIEEFDGELVVYINDYTCPKLNINDFYKNLIKNTSDNETSEFLQTRLNSALWLIKSIEQRKQTLLKVIESIISFQKEFFTEGNKAIKPLTLKSVAEDIGMHESTVSRATNGKYVQTPMGVYELKHFFATGLSGSFGDVSSTKIKELLKTIISEENPKKPYSDQLLSNIISARGIEVSRRTIAKYRDELGIPSSSLRKRF